MGLKQLKIKGSVQSGVAALMCLMMAVPMVAAPAPAAGKKHAKAAVKAPEQIQGDERIVHALDRLTWGPRPDDLEMVRAMGLQKWIDLQLNPSQLDDSAVDRMMGNFPALRLSPAEMVMHFPDNNLAKQAADGKIPMPTDPYLYAVYRDAIARYQQKKEKKADAGAAANGTAMAAGTGKNGAAMNGGGNDMNAMSPAMNGNAANASANAKKAGKRAPVMQTMNNGPSPDIRTNEERINADLQATKVLNLPPQERLMRLTQMDPDELAEFRARLSPPERAELAMGMSPQQRETLAALGNPEVVVTTELMQTKMLRSIETSRQLQDVMTDFWLNHFNVYIRKGQPEAYYIAQYEQDVLRPYALGRFEDLLVATAKSPAMLFYLDNWSSVGPDSPAVVRAKRAAEFSGNPQAKKNADRGLNENYGRELMELHTLGVDGGYTQKDVTQVASVFTGWTIDRPQLGGGFLFDERRHEPGPKTVLGHTIQENGEQEGLEVLHILAMSPATAHHVSREIAQRFVADDPPPALVDRMAKTWLDNDGDIRAVLKTMLSSPEFWAKDNDRAKVKTPIEYVVSAVRATGAAGTGDDAPVTSAKLTTALPLVLSMEKLDMPLFGQQPPIGYWMTADHWVSTSALLMRMNFALYLASGRMPGVQTDWSGLIGENAVAGGPESAEKRLEVLLLGEPASQHTHDAVMQQAANPAPPDQNALDRQFAVRQNPASPMALIGAYGGAGDTKPAASAEERQLEAMAGLLLGSPDFQKR